MTMSTPEIGNPVNGWRIKWESPKAGKGPGSPTANMGSGPGLLGSETTSRSNLGSSPRVTATFKNTRQNIEPFDRIMLEEP